MNGDVALKVDGLTKTYRLYNSNLDRVKESLHPLRRKFHHEFKALDNVEFEIRKGETVGIVGKNGSGKSTLLKIITGILAPSQGSVTVNGRVSALIELGAGFNPELTGIENIYFNGVLLGYSREEMDAKLDDILSFADIGEFIYQPVKCYSSGMFLRLSFSVAICVEPEILIIDEALAVGDAVFQAKCMSALDLFRRRGVSILLVTHDLSAVKSICNKAIYLSQGKCVAIGDVAYVTSIYAKDNRELINATLEGHTVLVGEYENNNEQSLDDSLVDSSRIDQLKCSTGFDDRVKLFRNGTGEVKVVYVEILDSSGTELNEIEYNKTVFIRVHILFVKECEVAVSYFIRDKSNSQLLGSSTMLEGVGLISGAEGSKKIIEFCTTMPLVEGNYNIQVIISMPTVLNKTAKCVDAIENAVVFNMLERRNVKIWAKMHVDNKIKIYE